MRKSSKLITLGICLILCLPLFPVAAYIGTHFIPQEYTSEATIDARKIADLLSSDTSPVRVDPKFIADQIQILQSKRVLLPVIDKLHLPKELSAGLYSKLPEDEKYQRLLKMIKVRRKGDADTLLISATRPDKQEAADLANGIALVYQQLLIDDHALAIDNDLSELVDEVTKQRMKMDTAKAELEAIRARENIHDPNPDMDVPRPTLSPNLAFPADSFPPDYNVAKKKYLDAKKQLDAVEQRYETEAMQLVIPSLPANIWVKAEPATTPSSPNVLHVLIAATGTGFLCALCGTAFLIKGLRLRRQEVPSSQV